MDILGWIVLGSIIVIVLCVGYALLKIEQDTNQDELIKQLDRIIESEKGKEK